MGEVFGIGVSDEAKGVIAEGELGVAEEGVVGGGDESSGHVEDGLGGAGTDTGGEFLGAGFEFGRQRFGHDRHSGRGQFPIIAQNDTEVNTFPTNFRDAYPQPSLASSFTCLCPKIRLL